MRQTNVYQDAETLLWVSLKYALNLLFFGTGHSATCQAGHFVSHENSLLRQTKWPRRIYRTYESTWHALVNGCIRVCSGMRMHLARQHHGVGDLVLIWASVKWKSVCTWKQQSRQLEMHDSAMQRGAMCHCAPPYRTGCNVGTGTWTSGVPRNFFRGGSTNSVEDRKNGDLGVVAP